jgi:hypothetical protein
LRSAHVERGLIGFNALGVRLAIGTLSALADQGLGAKLSRPQVAKIALEVAQAVENDASLFPDDPASTNRGPGHFAQ